MTPKKVEEIQVTTKNPKKVEAGKRLAEYNRRTREAQKSEVSQNYSTGALLAVGVIGGYCLYQAKKGVEPPPPQQPHPKTNKFGML